MGSRSNGNMEPVTQDELRKCKALMLEANVEMDNDALLVIVKMLRLGASPDAIYSVIKQIAPHCGIMKRFKLRSKPTLENK